jgi:hypothetical protein
MPNDFTKWQREAQNTPNHGEGDGKPIDLKWRASGRSTRREKYNQAQLEAQRDATIFRWGAGIVLILALVGILMVVLNQMGGTATRVPAAPPPPPPPQEALNPLQ